MAEESKPAAKVAVKAPEPVVLAHVSTSGQADVHRLVAERIAAQGDPERAAAVDAQLAALGFYV